MVDTQHEFLQRNDHAGNDYALFYTIYQRKHIVPGATLLVLHGMQEHSGRYDEFARYMAERGFVVLTYDHRGHGKTARNMSEMGFFRKNKPAQLLLEDVRAMKSLLEGQFPGLPHFVLGHSMGSFILRTFLRQEKSDFQGIILVGTGSRTPGAILIKAGLHLFNVLSPKSRPSFLNNIFGTINNARFRHEVNAGATSWLSVSMDNRNAFEQDPQCGVPFTVNGFLGLLTVHVRATSPEWSGNLPKDQPILFVGGSDDPIGDFGKGVLKVARHLEKAGFSDTTIKLYSGMRHEILNEDIRLEVFEDILQWMGNRVRIKI